MFDEDIPIKTEKGAMEIKSRSLGLAQRVRTVLLLVDGVKTVGELKRLLQSSGTEQSVLELLLSEGLIELPRSRSDAVPDTRIKTNGKGRTGVAPNTRMKAGATTLDAAPNTRIRANTRIRTNTRIRANTRPRGEAAAGPQSTPVLETVPKPAATNAPKLEPASSPDKKQEAQHVPTALASNTVVPDLKLTDLKLMIARAYLANELDNHLGIDGYLLKQKVMECASRTELEGLFDSIRKDLTNAFYVDAIDVIRQANNILNK